MIKATVARETTRRGASTRYKPQATSHGLQAAFQTPTPALPNGEGARFPSATSHGLFHSKPQAGAASFYLPLGGGGRRP